MGVTQLVRPAPSRGLPRSGWGCPPDHPALTPRAAGRGGGPADTLRRLRRHLPRGRRKGNGVSPMTKEGVAVPLSKRGTATRPLRPPPVVILSGGRSPESKDLWCGKVPSWRRERWRDLVLARDPSTPLRSAQDDKCAESGGVEKTPRPALAALPAPPRPTRGPSGPGPARPPPRTRRGSSGRACRLGPASTGTRRRPRRGRAARRGPPRGPR